MLGSRIVEWNSYFEASHLISHFPIYSMLEDTVVFWVMLCKLFATCTDLTSSFWFGSGNVLWNFMPPAGCWTGLRWAVWPAVPAPCSPLTLFPTPFRK